MSKHTEVMQDLTSHFHTGRKFSVIGKVISAQETNTIQQKETFPINIMLHLLYRHDRYQRVLLKLSTIHPTSHNSREGQTHVWSGPMGELVTWLCDHRA